VDRRQPKQARGLVADIAFKAKNRGNARTASLLRSYIGQMFRHGIELGLVDTDPTTTLKAKSLYDRAPRQRSLAVDHADGKPDEIKPLAEALGACGLHDRYQAAILVLLATLARVGELCKAEWQHLDLDAGTWRIPEENSKNSVARQIHLSPFAVRQFRRLAKFAEVGNPYVLPGRPERAGTSPQGRRPEDRHRPEDHRPHGQGPPAGRRQAAEEPDREARQRLRPAGRSLDGARPSPQRREPDGRAGYQRGRHRAVPGPPTAEADREDIPDEQRGEQQRAASCSSARSSNG